VWRGLERRWCFFGGKFIDIVLLVFWLLLGRYDCLMSASSFTYLCVCGVVLCG
jgi:hypothetical protein